ncbi:uncharacterized protein LOC126891689 [Diabrotica virgifera virgifera]|uniref:Uncharacterized protein n=1 Tax=Diabrotica virgifera virgifera TaxID=50390 RepID=A0ABM5L393_DIAVI|nr:uncharacterized protein LOC126891689 [Diabrotica virgifera virgifera]
MNIFTPIWIALLVAALLFAIAYCILVLYTRCTNKQRKGQQFYENKNQGFAYAGFKNEVTNSETTTEPSKSQLETKVPIESVSTQDEKADQSNPNAAKGLLVASALLQVLTPSSGNNQSSRHFFGGPGSNGASQHSSGNDAFGPSGSNSGRSHSKYALGHKARYNSVLLAGGIDSVDGTCDSDHSRHDTGGDSGGGDAGDGSGAGACDV